MGCTSSAPSMDGYISESYSASVKNENTSNDAEQNKEPSSKDVKLVLPSCDNLEKNLELACQNSIKNGASSEETLVETVPTSSSTNKLDENQENMTHHENDERNNRNDYENTNEEHYTTLREVVDKVMQDSTILQNQPSDDGDIEDDYDYDDKDEAKSFDDSDPPSVVEVEEVLVE
ncbi:uncharacterized protein LOC121738869, partial [Aricia agestis]|uniref:uncharacterized protein LOC121738869 n=1 Tax=Aricia agestis TaxID=91739 RepID=UPI001C207BD9